jgi:agmatinase
MFYDDAPEHWKVNSTQYKKLAQPIIEALEGGEDLNNHPNLVADLALINKVCRDLHTEVKEKVLFWMQKGKKVVLLGGDHSTPLGYYEALASIYDTFGILHLDAHMDLRIAYEGFTYSHASIMYNALQIPQISKIVQVGIRDFCEQEVQVVQESKGKVLVNTDADLKAEAFTGKTWAQQCDAIIDSLPQKVCISFDIDGMFQWYAPSTGTPVPGGFSFEQATYLFNKLAESGKEIIGFDLVEVAPGETDWDGNVAELLAKAIDNRGLDSVMTKEDADRLRIALREWGALDQNFKYSKSYRSSRRRGFERAQGGGVLGEPIPSDPHAFKDILDSGIWRTVAQHMNIDHQHAMFQPVGGMGMIGRGFAKQVEGKIRYT